MAIKGDRYRDLNPSQEKAVGDVSPTMSKMMSDDPVVRKRLDEAGQRARDQELRIIILEKEVEQLKGKTATSGADPLPDQRDSTDDKSKTKDRDRKWTPPKAGFKDDGISRNKGQATDEKSKYRTDSENRSSDQRMAGHPSSRRPL